MRYTIQCSIGLPVATSVTIPDTINGLPVLNINFEKINDIKKTQQYIDDRTKKYDNVLDILEKGNEDEKIYEYFHSERKI